MDTPSDQPYRQWVKPDLRSFRLRIEQSDLLISAERDLTDSARQTLHRARAELESYIERDPVFATTLAPHDPQPDAPEIALEMAAAARRCGVGPMAAVAGAVAQYVGEALLAESPQVIVENGGDIFLHTAQPRIAAIYAGKSPLSGRVGVKVNLLNRPVGLCTSSGVVGPSLSFGRADAAVVLADSAYLADAAATALGNRVKEPADIEPALQFVSTLPGLHGALVILAHHLGAWGEIELVKVEPTNTGGDWKSS